MVVVLTFLKVIGIAAIGFCTLLMWALCAYSGKIDEERGYDE